MTHKSQLKTKGRLRQKVDGPAGLGCPSHTAALSAQRPAWGSGAEGEETLFRFLSCVSVTQTSKQLGLCPNVSDVLGMTAFQHLWSPALPSAQINAAFATPPSLAQQSSCSFATTLCTWSPKNQLLHSPCLHYPTPVVRSHACRKPSGGHS